MNFTPAELRLLAISDRLDNPKGKWVADAERRPGGRPRKYGIGRLTDEEAMRLHLAGYTRAELAAAAGVQVRMVGLWRQRMGIRERSAR